MGHNGAETDERGRGLHQEAAGDQAVPDAALEKREYGETGKGNRKYIVNLNTVKNNIYVQKIYR